MFVYRRAWQTAALLWRYSPFVELYISTILFVIILSIAMSVYLPLSAFAAAATATQQHTMLHLYYGYAHELYTLTNIVW